MTEKEIINILRDLNTDRNPNIWDDRTRCGAPHKPFLLLSIMDGIEIGWIDKPQITLSQDLIETFFRYWKQIMGKERNTTIALPFFHMASEPFWDLQYNEGAEPYKNSPSLGGLMKRVKYARLDDRLYNMMQDEEGKQIVRSTLLHTYFSDVVRDEIMEMHRINIGAYNYARQLELLAAEPFQKYYADEDEMTSYSWQKTQQRRQGFGIAIRENYTHRCAICRAKVKTPNGESLVEGAHIIPWSESRNDDPRNGLALCKTHHWMFDTSLLTVQPDYRIKLSTWLKKEGKNIEHTLEWDRKEILLPEEERFMPSEEALEEHWERFSEVNE